jgi:hypothetical protein
LFLSYKGSCEAFAFGCGDGAGKSCGFGCYGFASQTRQLVITAAVVVRFRFFDEAGSEHAFEAAVKGAGAKLKGVVGLPGDVLHDGVAVALLVRERQQNMEYRWCQR